MSLATWEEVEQIKRNQQQAAMALAAQEAEAADPVLTAVRVLEAAEQELAAAGEGVTMAKEGVVSAEQRLTLAGTAADAAREALAEAEKAAEAEDDEDDVAAVAALEASGEPGKSVEQVAVELGLEPTKLAAPPAPAPEAPRRRTRNGI